MMRNLRNRSTEIELMDDPNVPEKALKDALLDISKVNRMLGGNLITIRAIEKLFKENSKKRKWTIVDIGCGDGEMLRLIVDKCKDDDLELNLIGLDINSQSIDIARSMSKNYPEISFIKKDVMMIDVNSFTCDIVICTLTIHHFTDEEILKFIKQFTLFTKVGIIINDLHRSRVAYVLYMLFSRIFIRSYVAKNDGLVSIASAFKKHELETFAKKLKLKTSKVTWKWAFRYLWLIKTV